MLPKGLLEARCSPVFGTARRTDCEEPMFARAFRVVPNERVQEARWVPTTVEIPGISFSRPHVNKSAT